MQFFFSSYGVADTEEGAASICQEIHAKLKVGAPADAPKQEFKKLEQAVNLKAKVEEQTEQRRTVCSLLSFCWRPVLVCDTAFLELLVH